MTDTLLFDPRDERYKSPYGAVSAGTVVHFALRPERAQAFSRAVLTARFESRANELVRIFLPWSGRDGERDVFAGSLPTGDYVGLIFYSFRLEGLDGRTRTLGEYQLTVYDGCEQVPAWFGEGTCYQIFPDRFRRSRIPDPGGMVGGRSVHAAWQEEPEYRPDARGEVRNRDFFGGDLKGVLEQLPYLQSLGVETLYFNPIFEAAENHRYGTADYEHVDPMLGCDADFSALCQAAHARGMRVILDGVFNHTGFVSRYFNGDGFYPQPGAAQSRQSPYYPWFHFQHWPDRFDSWWGIYTLPAVNEGEDSYRDYIIRGEHSIVRRWLQAGADGWRLDVADELPDDFIRELHQAVRAADPNAVVIGEVWEDGSTKIAYGVRRKHILGGHCDGLMNYPLRNAILAFFTGGGAEHFVDTMETIRENYPVFAFYGAMNSLGTHDTPRILTLLGAGGERRNQSRDWRANFRLEGDALRTAKERLRAAALLLFCFPGSPTVYYGDEAGMEGFEDPFNRRTYPWGHEDGELLDWFKQLGALRKTHPALRRGTIRYVAAEGPLLAFARADDGEEILCVCNAGDGPVALPLPGKTASILVGSPALSPLEEDEGVQITLSPRSGAALLLGKK